MIKAKLELYLGFLHSTAKGKPSLIWDFVELYRYLIDDFIVQYCMKLKKHGLTIKNEEFSIHRKGKREYLKTELTHGLAKELNKYFRAKLKIPGIRMGDSQEIETLISEEALLLAKFLRKEVRAWIPRIAPLHP